MAGTDQQAVPDLIYHPGELPSADRTIRINPKNRNGAMVGVHKTPLIKNPLNNSLGIKRS